MLASTLVKWWEAARSRTLVAEHGEPVDVEDYWTELALGAWIAREVVAGRWMVVAQLLRASAINHWDQVGAALGVTGEEAAAGFTAWLSSQGRLYHETGYGLTHAQATELVMLADTVGGSR